MHPVTTVCIDQEAAAQLKLQDYYKWVFDNKPVWQRF